MLRIVIHGMNKLLLLTLLCVSSVGDAAMYRWIDDDGKIHLSNRSPQHSEGKSTEVEKLIYQTPTQTGEKVKEENKKSKKIARKVVVMYSASWCRICDRARNYFKKKNIEFTEYDVDKSQKGKRDYKKLRANGVPIIFVGKKRLNGFTVKSFNKAYGS